MRELEALEIAPQSKVAFDGKSFLVPSQSGNSPNKVQIGDTPSCTCEDFQIQQNGLKGTTLG